VGKGQKGFTLIEILMVVVIIIIIAALILPNVLARPVKARVARTIGDRYELSKAAIMFYQDTGLWPGEACNSTDSDINSATDWQYLWIEGKEADGTTSISDAEPPYLTKFIRNAAWPSSYYEWCEDDDGSPYGINGAFSWSDIAYILIDDGDNGTAVPGSDAQKLDNEFDDGVPNTGTVRADTNYSATKVKLFIFCFRK